MRNQHNTRGNHSKTEFGFGYITEKGYHRVWDINQKRYRFMHNIVWEQHYGEIPDGMYVHHKDHNKLNNDISNLELVDALQHKRLHSGCIVRDGVMLKPCRKCGEYKPLDQYYKRKSGISPWCKSCCVKNAVDNKKRRKADADNKRTVQ